MLWTWPIELLKIGQYGFLLGALINLHDSTRITTDDGFSNILAIVFLLIYIIFTVAILVILVYFKLDIPYLVKNSEGLKAKNF